MLHPIEIKANIEGGVGQALAALGDPVPATKRQIWFAEDRGGLQAGGQLKMLSHGIILRIRIGEGPDDSTAKLRPVDKEQLTKQWSKPFQEPFKYRIEGDWSGDRHALAASAQTSHPQGSLAESVGAGRFDQVFTPEQRQFVRDCAHIGVDINQLVGLGPIASTQWEDLQIGGVDDVNAERWTVADLDFLELSIRVTPKKDESAKKYRVRAERAQKDLLAAIADLGLQLSSHAENTTQRVLAALVTSDALAPESIPLTWDALTRASIPLTSDGLAQDAIPITRDAVARAAAGEKVLPYDHSIVPQETGYWCGPAAAQVVLNSRGIHVAESDLARSIGTHTGGTDYVGLIERDLDRRVPQAGYVSVYLPNDPPTSAQRDRLWRDLVRGIDAGWGMIMNWVAPPSNYPRGVKGSISPRYGGGTVYHYVAAMGYDNTPGARAVWIADSGFWPFGYWCGFNQVATLIPPKGYTYSDAAPAPPLFDESTEIRSPYRGSRRGTDVLWFVLHTEDGNSPSARHLAGYLSNNEKQVSYHYTVDNDGHVYNIVDTKFYANSVLQPGNSKSINLAFAGSWASWSRQTWFDRMQHGIDVAAYIAVRDARRYGLQTRVISPEEARNGMTGITDHNGVRIATGVGTHTDVGAGFDWDYFRQKVSQYAAMAPAEPALRSEAPQPDRYPAPTGSCSGQSDGPAELGESHCQ